jgi:monoterpene epsilon-lactone hydrolase
MNDRTASSAAPPAGAGALQIPARALPTPSTISPAMQKIVGAPPRPNWDVWPETAEAWRALAQAWAAPMLAAMPAMRERLQVDVETSTLPGVRGFLVTPRLLPPGNRDRLLVHLHGGCYVLNPGEAGLPEALMMASFGGFKVLSVDYRMPPEAYFPAALDDAVAAWRAALGVADPMKMAIFGTSAGGALTLATILRLKQERLPLPAAIASGTPMSDATKTGDTFYANERVDNVLVSRDGFCDAAAHLYANGHDMADPFLSPVYGDLSGFPPTILTSGTRDLLLSNTVRVHRKLRQAKVEAALHVYEAQAHAHYLRDDQAPETREAFEEIAAFFDERLGR